MATDTLKRARTEFKKHMRRAAALKEGGSAWDREITLARKWLVIGKAEMDHNWQKSYK